MSLPESLESVNIKSLKIVLNIPVGTEWVQGFDCILTEF